MVPRLFFRSEFGIIRTSVRAYPIFLNLTGYRSLVIGGGKIAARKINVLLSSGAKVTVVASAVAAEVARLARRKKILLRKRRFTPADLSGAQLVIAATDDQQVNELASRVAKRKGIWINVVDQPALCSFIFPAVVHRGKLVIAVSTGGASPALAKWIRRDLEKRYGAEFRRLLEKMAAARGRIKEKVPGIRRRKELFERALSAYMKVLETAG